MSLSVDLSDRCYLVTGATGGLGAKCAAVVARAGASVVLSDLPGPVLDHLADELKAEGASVYVVPADFSDGSQVRTLAARAASEAGRIDGLVNFTGVMQTKPLADITQAEWSRLMDINLTGAFLVTQSVGTYLLANGGGAIVLVSSIAGRSGRPNAPHYAASKAGVLSLTKSAAMAFAPLVRVNAVCPGVFMTPMWERIMQERDREFGAGSGQAHLDAHVERVALGRVGRAEELATVVAYFLSDLSSYVTGQAINVDGGLEMN